MKPTYFIFLSILILSSCSRNYIVFSKNKNSSDNNETKNINSNSILENSVKFFKLSSRSSNDGIFNIFLITDSLYIEAKSKSLTKDSLTLTGSVQFNQKKQRLNFELHYYNKISPVSIIDTTNGIVFNTKIARDTFNNSSQPAYLMYYLKKTDNIIIEPNRLELLTGETIAMNGQKVKYIILNDPIDKDYYLTSIGLLDGAFISTIEKQLYYDKCNKEKGSRKCKEYYAKIYFYWYKYIVDCICIN